MALSYFTSLPVVDSCFPSGPAHIQRALSGSSDDGGDGGEELTGLPVTGDPIASGSAPPYDGPRRLASWPPPLKFGPLDLPDFPKLYR